MGQLFSLFKKDLREKAINGVFGLWKDLAIASIFIGVLGGFAVYVTTAIISHGQFDIFKTIFPPAFLALELSIIGLNIFKAVGMYYFSLKRRVGEYKEEAHK